jgi:hypothetical protein
LRRLIVLRFLCKFLSRTRITVIKVLTLVVVTASGIVFNSSAGGGWLQKQAHHLEDEFHKAPAPVQILTAPVAAPVEAATTVMDGNTPSVEQTVAAFNSTVATVVETDKQTGVSDAVRNLAQLPKSANEAAKSGKQTADTATAAVNEIRPIFPGFKSAIAGFQKDTHSATRQFGSFLAAISVPAQFMLWALTLLFVTKIARFLLPKPVRR